MSDDVNERLDRIEAQLSKFGRLAALELTNDEIEALELARKLLVNVKDGGGRTVKLAGELLETWQPRCLTLESKLDVDRA